jgi:hypothetical protein
VLVGPWPTVSHTAEAIVVRAWQSNRSASATPTIDAQSAVATWTAKQSSGVKAADDSCTDDQHLHDHHPHRPAITMILHRTLLRPRSARRSTTQCFTRFTLHRLVLRIGAATALRYAPESRFDPFKVTPTCRKHRPATWSANTSPCGWVCAVPPGLPTPSARSGELGACGVAALHQRQLRTASRHAHQRARRPQSHPATAAGVERRV